MERLFPWESSGPEDSYAFPSKLEVECNEGSEEKRGFLGHKQFSFNK